MSIVFDKLLATPLLHTHRNDSDIGGPYVLRVGDTMTGALINTASSGNTLVWDTSTLIVDATNHRVGIGTAAPGVNLDILGTDGTNLLRLISGTSGNGANQWLTLSDQLLQINRQTGSNAFFQIATTNTGAWGANANAGSITLAPNNSAAMTILTGGNVGIGITNPGSLLTVGSASYFTVASTGVTTITPSADSTSVLKITNQANTNPVLQVDTTNGRVGINIAPSVAFNLGYGYMRFEFVTKPTAPTVALAGLGAGSLTNGAYTYQVTFSTANGETEAGTTSATVTVVDATTNGQVALTAIPTSTNVFVTTRKIYRTISGGTTYKLLTTLSDNTTTTFTDNVADGSLGATAPVINKTSGRIRANGTDMIVLDSATGFIGLLGQNPTNTIGVTIGKTWTGIDQAKTLDVSTTHNTATSGTVYGFTVNTTASNTTGTMNSVQGMFSQAIYGGAQSAQGNIAVSALTGLFNRVTLGGASSVGTITGGEAVRIDNVSNQMTGSPLVTITTQKGIRIVNQGAGSGTNGLTITNAVGIVIEAMSSATNYSHLVIGQTGVSSGTYGIYNASTANNYFNGPLGLGQTAPTTWIDNTATSTRGAVVFTGSGLNDATSGGTYVGNTTPSTFTIIIDGTGATDTFKWQKDSGTFYTGIAMTGAFQTLVEGVTIKFTATTGHTLTDQWTIAVTAVNTFRGLNANSSNRFNIGQDGSMGIGGALSTTRFVNLVYNPQDPPNSYASVFVQPVVTITNANTANTMRAAYIEIQDAASALSQGTYRGMSVFATGRALSGSTVTSLGAMNFGANTATTATGNYTEIVGINGNASHLGTGTVTTLYGNQAQVKLSPSGGAVDGNVTTAYLYWGQLQNLSTGATPGVISSAYYFYAGNPTLTGAITNIYGVYVQNQGGAKATNVAGAVIAAQSGATNQTNLLIGTTTIPTGSYSTYDASTNNSVYAGKTSIGTTTAPTALLMLAAGAIGASSAPLKFTSGSLQTTAEAGAVEFLTDKYYATITTAAARKEFTLNDSALTSGKIPVATTNGRLQDSTASLLVAGSIATVVASTFEKAETGSDANILTYTTNASTDEYLVVAVSTDVSALTGTSVVVTVTWKDSNNSTATSSITLSGVGDGTINVPINGFKNTSVVVSSVFVGVSVAYNISAFVTRLK